MTRVLVIGSLSLDCNHVGGRVLRKLGGVVTYGGLTLRRHGLETAAVTSLGEADRACLAPLAREGIRLHCRFGATSTRFVNASAGEDRVQRLESVAEPIRAEDLPALADGDLVVLGALHADDVDPGVFDALEARRIRVTTDVQGFVRRRMGAEVRAEASPHLERVLRRSRVVKADEGEIEIAEAALGCTRAEMPARFGVDELIVTGGDRGGCIHLRDATACRYEAGPVLAVEDPTGAGDVFLAAYLCARAVGRHPPAEAAREAARLAARQVEGRWLEASLLALPPA